MEKEELLKLIETKRIIGVDLSGEKLEKIDFSGCTLERVNFKGCEMVHCRFRNAKISWSDFRYVEMQHGTFEGAQLDFCDFYRAFIDGVVMFNGSSFSNCSLNKTYLGDCAVIRKENLRDNRILQQNKEDYRKFLVDWHTYGTGERTNDLNRLSDWNPQDAVDARWADAEVIYKNLNALWSGKGYIADGNWAYVQGKRMERWRMIGQLNDKRVPVFKKAEIVWHICTNFMSDLFFGYGESMTKMILTYIFTVFFFAWAFTENVTLLEYSQAFGISLKNMVGMDSDILQDVSPLVDMLNVIQTTIGILLTGIFGFILGNKIRNQ